MNKEITVTCFDINNEGKGVVKFDSKIGFVDYLLPEEEAIIEVIYERKDYFLGKIKKIIKPSKDRIEPPCRHFFECGGCSLMHLSYDKQLKFKQKKVKDCLERIGGLKDIKVEETVPMDYPFNYRNKIQVPIKSKNKEIVSGFYKEKSHDIVKIDKCYIEDKRASKILEDIRTLLKKYKIKPYDEDRHTGLVRHVLIRTSHKNDEIMVTLVLTEFLFPKLKDFIKDLRALNKDIKTVTININPRKTNVILGQQDRIITGKGYIEDDILGVKFRISPKSFYQVNPIQVEKLYSIALNNAFLSKDDTFLDAYSGIGTIGLIASKNVKFVTGIEIEPSAVKDAINNQRENKIDNAEFYQGDAGEFILEQAKHGINYSVVCMDPPRKGSDEKFLKTILKTKPSKVIYISCDPATLARDLKYLSQDYSINKVTPVDMFPHTFHVESVVSLVNKRYKN